MPKSSRKDQVKMLENEIETEYLQYENLFAQLDDTDSKIEKKIEEVNSLIEQVNQRIFYTEGRLSKLVTFSVALMGIGMAFFAAIIKLAGLTFIIGIITSFSFFFTGGFTALVHCWFYVNPRYPFRTLKNDWKWFYAGIIDKEYHPKPLFQDSSYKFLFKRRLHIQGLNKYAKKILDEKSVDRLKVDLQQLYLLHVNEKYKNYYLSNLRNILIYGLLVTSSCFIILVGSIAYDKIITSSTKDKVTPPNITHQIKPIEKPEEVSGGQHKKSSQPILPAAQPKASGLDKQPR